MWHNLAKDTVMSFEGGCGVFVFAYDFISFVCHSPEAWGKKASHKEAFYR